MNNVTAYLFDLMRRFHSEDEGIALTEYLVMLGLLIGGVILAVTAFGDGLAATWNSWATWITSNLNAPANT